MIERHMAVRKLVLAAGVGLALQGSATWAKASADAVWVPAYLSSPCAPIVGVPAAVIPPPQEIQGTVRYRITLGAGGQALTIRLSNETGRKPLHVSHVTVALANGAGRKFVDVTFGGARDVVMEPGAPALSDPVAVPAAAGSDILVSLHLPDPFTHTQADGLRPTQYSPGADQTSAPTLTQSKDLFVRPIVSGVFTQTLSSRRDAIVTLGDSITDGTGAQSTELRGWPERLALRARKAPASHVVIANAGISGNRVLTDGWGISALARFDRDVLAVPSVKHVIILEGINDIGSPGAEPGANPPPTYADMLAAYRQLIARAHQRQVRVTCATILPFKGSFYFSPQKEQLRQQINAWVRSGGECDAHIDFDRAMGEPGDPLRLRQQFDSGDHLHPNDEGYRAMADAVDLRIFR